MEMKNCNKLHSFYMLHWKSMTILGVGHWNLLKQIN